MSNEPRVMGRMEYRARLIGCFRRTFPAMGEPEILNASMKNVGEWDSAALLTLLAAVEKEFALQLTSEQINLCTSFASILDLVQRPTAEER